MKGLDLESMVVVDRRDDQLDAITLLHSDNCGVVLKLLALTLISFVSRRLWVPGSTSCARCAHVGLCMSVTAMRTQPTTAALRSSAPTHSRYLEAGCDRLVGNNAARTTTRRFWGKSVRYFHSAQDAAKMSRKRNNQECNERECPIPQT